MSPSAVARVVGEHPDVRVAGSTDQLVASALDVYAPCALGGALTDDVVEVLSAKIVCGAANNQLAHPGVEKALEERGILYAPDYCVNSGGLIQVADELEGFSFERAKARAGGIFDTTREVFALAASDGVRARDRRRPARRAPDARRGSPARRLAPQRLNARARRSPRSAGETVSDEAQSRRLGSACADHSSSSSSSSGAAAGIPSFLPPCSSWANAPKSVS